MVANAGSIYAGIGPDPVTGTVLNAPYGTTLPVTTQAFFEATPNVAFIDSGFIGEKGVVLSTPRKFFDVTDMSGAVIDTIQNGFSGIVKTTFLELNAETLGNLHGDGSLATTAATAGSGVRQSFPITGLPLDATSWIFRMKTGRKRVGIVVPRGRVTTQSDLEFNAAGTASVDVEISTIPTYDGVLLANVNAYVITDDGMWTVSTVPTISSATPSAVPVGQLVTILGSRFTGTVATTGVKFNAVNATAWVVVSDSMIIAEMPTGTAGAGNIIVTNAAGASTAFTYTRGA
jgi:hypothetical protein